MNEITYLDAIKESSKVGQKPAKISQEKIVRLKNNYNSNLKTVSPSVQPAPVQAPVVDNVVNIPVQQPVSAPVVSDNYTEVAANFNMSIYEKSFDELPLTGARKIRINSKLPLHIKGQSNKLANGKLENVIPMPKEVVNETIPNVVENNIEAKIVDFPKPQTSPIVNDSIAKDISSPSVDDYLQKEIPDQTSGIIVQLTGDVQKLKEQTVERTALLEELEKKYNDLKSKREQRIRDLEEEKLSYTATLEGLTERIRSLQDAIAQEEQTLTGYKKTA